MKKVTVLYWSGTGNTEIMANAIAEGVKKIGNDVDVVKFEDANKGMVVSSDLIAFGCPSMGAEVLEEDYVDPFIGSLEDVDFSGKVIALFGSYDWGDGEWMRNWEEQMQGYGAKLVDPGLIVQLTPDEDGTDMCRSLGEKLASA